VITKSKASRHDRVKNDKVSQRVTEDTNILHRVKRRKGDWVGNSMRRNRLLIKVKVPLTDPKAQRGVEV
jgi:hypothetical protein